MRPLTFFSIAAPLSTLLLLGCATPATALKPNEKLAEHRQLQTRRFDRMTEAALLSSGLGVLQDLGFTLDDSESKLGVISASRQLSSRRPLNPRELVTDLLWVAMFPMVMAPYMAYDAATGVKEPQIVRVSLVTAPIQGGEPAGCAVRITAQRLVYKDEKLTKLLKVEALNDPAFYQEFFTRLARSVALEDQKT